MLHISHHERVEGHPHRWHVFLHGRSEPVAVEVGDDLELSDDEVHNLLPSALQRHADETGEEYHDTSWDAPVRMMQTHFIA